MYLGAVIVKDSEIINALVGEFRKLLWTEEPGGLPPMGSHRVRHNCSDLAAAAAAGCFQS